MTRVCRGARPLFKAALLSSALLSIPLPWAPAAHALAVPADCDYLVITDSLLLPEARRLATFRDTSAADLVKKSHVATMADIYEDYPTHGPKSRAISLFLRDVNGKNGRLPAHLLLFGDASRNEASPDNRVPTLVYRNHNPSGGTWDNPIYDTVISDDGYAELLDTIPTDSLRPLTAMGRIPAGSLEEARLYVDKVIAYEGRFPYGPGAFTYGFASDDDVQVGQVESIEILPELHEWLWDSVAIKPFVRRLLTVEFPLQAGHEKPAARDSLVNLLQGGPARFYFVGHGDTHQLTDEKLFQVPGDLVRLKPNTLPPIAAMLTGPGAAFAEDGVSSMGEELLFHPHGVIAFLGSIKETYPMPNNYVFSAWDDTASRGGTLGSSFSHAKAVSSDVNGWANSILGLGLLGDPALTLHVPAIDLSPASGSGQSRLVLQGAGSQGDSVYCQLVQVDSILYDPFLHPENNSQRGKKFLRERMLGEIRAVLGAGGNILMDLPSAPNPYAAAAKVMTWNRGGMRYGHFPLSDLGPIAVRGAGPRKASIAPYRLVLEGTSVRILWNRPPRPGEAAGMVRTFDLKGAIRR